MDFILVTGAAPGFGAACFAQVDELADGLLTWCGPARSSTQRAAHRIKTRAAQTTGGKARKFCNAAGRAAVAIDGRLADVEH